MPQYITYNSNMYNLGIGTKVQLRGKVVEIAGDKSEHLTLKIEIIEFEKLYEKGW